MTIITICVPVKNTYEKTTRKNHTTKEEYVHIEHKKDILYDDITVNEKICGIHCACRCKKDNIELISDNVITQIHDELSVPYKLSHDSEKIEKILNVIKSTKIYDLIRVLNDEQEYPEARISYAEKILNFNIGSVVNTRYPYIEKFKIIEKSKIIEKFKNIEKTSDDDNIDYYEAVLHISDYNSRKKIYITTQYEEAYTKSADAGNCSNYIMHNIPIEMSIGCPASKSDVYSIFNKYLTFKKYNHKYMLVN